MWVNLDTAERDYAINVHVAQGMSQKNGIAMMSGRDKMLNTGQSFLVAVTRFAENVTLVVDDPTKVQRDITHNPDGKTSAIEETQKAQSVENRDVGSVREERQIDRSTEPQIERSRDFDFGM